MTKPIVSCSTNVDTHSHFDSLKAIKTNSDINYIK